VDSSIRGSKTFNFEAPKVRIKTDTDEKIKKEENFVFLSLGLPFCGWLYGLCLMFKYPVDFNYQTC